jgi:hypothetical protein
VSLSDGSKRTVMVTNFLFPSAFDESLPGPFDWMGELKNARDIAPNGYKISQSADGKQTTVFGSMKHALAFSHAKLKKHGALEVAKLQLEALQPTRADFEDEDPTPVERPKR